MPSSTPESATEPLDRVPGLPSPPGTHAAPVSIWRRVLRNRAVMVGGLILMLMLLIALLAPWLGTVDPTEIDAASRNRKPGAEITLTGADGESREHTAWFGTDNLGRDLYSRVLYGTRVSLTVGFTVSVIAISIGLVIGLVAGFARRLDGPVMRLMDGLMAIPGILLAIALVAVWGGGLTTVILAIVVPDVPRVVRLVRSVVLSVREEPYVEAAISVGAPTIMLLMRHVLPNTLAPLIVQGTFLCASAMLSEAALSFLGMGIPPEIPSWGNIIAEGRSLFRIHPHNIFYPGLFLALTVLAVNVLGDGLRDTLDPKMSRRL
jgi:peptide/nickel transport system permease protein